MARRTPGRLKRSPNVFKSLRDSAKEMELKSSDDDNDEVLRTNKVRKELSVCELIRESEHFKPDADHIYTKSQGNRIMDIGNGIPRVCLTRSSSLSSPSESEKGTEGGGKVRVKRQKCFSKNAVLARLNREKKKQYISSLESNNEDLQKQNNQILEKINSQEKVIKSLRYEVSYLKSLLANSKEISEMLKNLKHSTGLPVTSSLRSSVSNENFENLSEEVNTAGMCNPMPVKDTCTRQPCVKRVTSGSNFPILQKDVNLGCFSDDDPWSHDLNEESHSFSDSYLDVDNFFNDIDCDLTTSMFDSQYDPVLSDGFNKEEEPVKSSAFPSVETDVGLCLHVNKRKISVELCSLCNSRAQMQ